MVQIAQRSISWVPVVESTGQLPLAQLPEDEVLDLFQRHGAVLVHGFQAQPAEFEQFSECLSGHFSTYQGGTFNTGAAARQAVNSAETMFTATGATQDFGIPLHGELYYFQAPPDLIWFYCVRPPSEGGETTLGDGAQIYRALSPATQRVLSVRKILYHRRLANGVWQAVFRTDDRQAVEEFCRVQGTAFAWGADGGLVTEYRCSPLVQFPGQGPVFINQLVVITWGKTSYAGPGAQDKSTALPYIIVRWGNGEPLPAALLEELAQVSAQHEVAVPWQAGDFLMVDNRRVMHGRRVSPDKERMVYVRMGKAKAPAQA